MWWKGWKGRRRVGGLLANCIVGCHCLGKYQTEVKAGFNMGQSIVRLWSTCMLLFSHDGNLSLRQGYLTKLCPANTKSYWMLKACSVAVRIQLRSRLSMLCSIALLCSHRFSEGRMPCSSALCFRMRFSMLCSIALLCSQQFSEGRIQLLLFECGRCLCCAGASCRNR